MPAAAIIPLVVEASGLSSIVAGSIATATGLSTAAASIAGSALIGSATGALSAEVQGGNVIKGALGGLVSAGVGAGVGQLASEALGGVGAVGEFGPQVPVRPTLAGSEALGAGAVKGLSGLAGGTAGALATGQPIGSALKSGLISGVSGGLSAGIGNALDLGGVGTGALGGALSYGLGKAFQPSVQSRSTIPTQLGATGFQSPAGQGTSSALGSALFAAPGLSYSPGGPVLGGSSEDKAPKNVWSETDKSLRDVGSTVT